MIGKGLIKDIERMMRQMGISGGLNYRSGSTRKTYARRGHPQRYTANHVKGQHPSVIRRFKKEEK